MFDGEVHHVNVTSERELQFTKQVMPSMNNKILTINVCCKKLDALECEQYPWSKTTNPALLNVYAINITEHPKDVNKLIGEYATFTIATTYEATCPDDDMLLYNWKLDGEVVEKITTSQRSLNLTKQLNLQHDNKTISVEVCCKKVDSNECEETPFPKTSNTATIRAHGIKIIEHPQDVEKLVGEIAIFSISVEWSLSCPDQDKLLYKWKRNGVVIHTTVTDERSALFEKQMSIEDNNSLLVVDACCKKLNEEDCESAPAVESSNPAKIVVFDPSRSDSGENDGSINSITISAVLIVLLSYLLCL